MKATLVILILGVLFALCNAQWQDGEEGPTPCAAQVPNVETDAFNPRESWTSGGSNFTIWEHRFNFFTSSGPYKVHDIFVRAEPLVAGTQLVQLWELEPVSGQPGYYRFPAWRRDALTGISGGQSHSFGYITQGSPAALMLTFDIVRFTCTPGFDVTVA